MTPLPPPPRRIRSTESLRSFFKWVMYGLLAAVAGATVVFGGALANEAMLRWMGHDVMADVQSVHEHPNSAGTYNRIARYTYAIPGSGAREDESRISWREFRRLSMPFITAEGRADDMIFSPESPGKLPVRAYAIGPLKFSRAVEHAWGAMLWVIPAIFFPLGTLLTAVLYRAVVIRPRRYRWLYTHGTAVAGTIIERHAPQSADDAQYGVTYQFTPKGAAAPIVTGAGIVGRNEYDAAAPGTVVTVLYDPADPIRSAVYEYGGFRCA